MASGDTKTEALLNVLGNGGDASAYRGCCNTKTQNYILDAIDRVQNVEDEVERLENNPDVVDIVATYADLEAYDTSGLTDKDIIRVLEDSTHNNNSTYYRWNATTNQFDFVGEISGGSSVNVVQTTGTSTTDVMSQNAVTSMVFADPSTRNRINIGGGSYTTGNYGIKIGKNSHAPGANTIAIGGAPDENNTTLAYADRSIALGMDAQTNASAQNSLALGAYSETYNKGEVNIGTPRNTTAGYNNTAYRLLSGVHDPVGAHDAATKGYVDANAGGGAKELTSADYDYPDANPRGVALWRLPAGMYWTKQGVKVFYSTSENSNSGETLIVSNSDYNALVDILRIYSAGGYGTYRVFKTGKGDGSANNTYSNKDLLYSELVYADTINRTKIQIGDGANANGASSVCVGTYARSNNKTDSVNIGPYCNNGADYSVCLGYQANTGSSTVHSAAIGSYATTTRAGEVNIGTGATTNGYNSTSYRVLGGVHDGQTAHDAVTVEQVNATIDAINTALSTNIPHIGLAS